MEQTHGLELFELSSTSLVTLAAFPLMIWALFVFVQLPGTALSRRLHESWFAGTKEEALQGARLWAVAGLITHILIAVLVASVSRWGGRDSTAVLFQTPHVFALAMQGVLVGLALTGTLPLMRLILPEPRRFRLSTLVSIGPSVPLSLATLAIFTFAQELWRVQALRSLIQEGSSSTTALLIASVLFGFAFSMSGISTGASAAFTGALFGALYLWQGSFLLPFVAHFVFQTQLFVLALAAPPSAVPSHLPEIHKAKCPVCSVYIDRRSDERSPTLGCPNCKTILSVSDSRVALIRWGSVIFMMGLTYLGFSAFRVTLGANEHTLWICYLLALPAYTSVLIVGQILFPPQLQPGGPGFITLDLTNQSQGGSGNAIKPKTDIQ